MDPAPKPVRRSYFEVPLMDPRKWAKVPSIPADVFLLDMEDSCPPDLKPVARERILQLICDPSHLGGREIIVRPNNLRSPWGAADIRAIAGAGVRFVLYPKVRDAEEMQEVWRLFQEHGASPEIMAIVETPQAVLRLDAIAASPGLAALLLGLGDLSMETGTSLTQGRGEFREGFLYARSQVLLAARAHGLQPVDAVFTADLKDLDAVREGIQFSRRMGFTGIMSFYPPHVPLINEIMTPAEEELRWAERVVAAYEEGRAKGLAALTVDGKWLTVHQYAGARATLQAAVQLGLRSGAAAAR